MCCLLRPAFGRIYLLYPQHLRSIFGSHSLSGCVLRRSLEATENSTFCLGSGAGGKPERRKTSRECCVGCFRNVSRAMMENSFGTLIAVPTPSRVVSYFLFKNQFYADEIFMEKLLRTNTNTTAESFPLRAESFPP